MQTVKKATAPCVVILGTASDVGKSIVTTALCRILAQKGLRVAPFKAQNMSNNSFVSIFQGEVARAQAVQAEAAGIEPNHDMNPVLLKPSSDQVCQVVVHGKAIGNRSAADYFSDTSPLLKIATESLDRLRQQFDVVVVEGAGSCAEVNLRSRDFTNLEIAHHADAPAILVADIDRGGVFAQVIGTLEVLDRKDRDRIRGIIINRFRGDPRLFVDGIRYIEEKTGLPVLGLIPHYSDITIDSEDGLPLEAEVDPVTELDRSRVNIGVILLPHISNFTDFAPLEQTEGVALHYLRSPRDISGYDLVVLPGSKNTREDLAWCHAVGWTLQIQSYARSGGRIAGICGGYQMLGLSISDPNGIESAPGTCDGLCLLPVTTVLESEKKIHRSSGIWKPFAQPVFGYEIHHGSTVHTRGEAQFPLQITQRNGMTMAAKSGELAAMNDGAISENGKIWGCYLHGLFDSLQFRMALLKQLGNGKFKADSGSCLSSFDFRQQQYDRLADHFRANLDMPKLERLIFA